MRRAGKEGMKHRPVMHEEETGAAHRVRSSAPRRHGWSSGASRIGPIARAGPS
jgi:hypothetical protein